MKRTLKTLSMITLLAVSLLTNAAFGQNGTSLELIDIFFVNQSTEPAKVELANGTSRQLYMTVPAGETRTLKTYIGNQWAFSGTRTAMGGAVTRANQVFALQGQAASTPPAQTSLIPPMPVQPGMNSPYTSSIPGTGAGFVSPNTQPPRIPPQTTPTFPAQVSTYPTQTSTFPTQPSTIPTQISTFPTQPTRFPTQPISFENPQGGSFGSDPYDFPNMPSYGSFNGGLDPQGMYGSFGPDPSFGGHGSWTPVRRSCH